MRLPALLMLLAALPASSWAQERSTVHLFQYGSTNAPASATAFLDFRDLMSEKLPRLASELLADDDRAGGLTNLDALALQPVQADGGDGLEPPSARIPNLQRRRQYWRDTGALALLTGRVKGSDPASLVIRSTFFLGELGQPTRRETLDVELPFTAAVYDTTNDSHSVVLLYALAMEALGMTADGTTADCNRQAHAYFLLSQASLRADSVATDDRDLGAALATIVQDALDAVKAACPA
ncbi:MAG: hypothetical protein AAFX81_10805 [Pseudomonadota bacterium]